MAAVSSSVMCSDSLMMYFIIQMFVFHYAGPVGGYCIEPDECLCREWFSGENCEEGEGCICVQQAPTRSIFHTVFACRTSIFLTSINQTHLKDNAHAH